MKELKEYASQLTAEITRLKEHDPNISTMDGTKTSESLSAVLPDPLRTQAQHPHHDTATVLLL